MNGTQNEIRNHTVNELPFTRPTYAAGEAEAEQDHEQA